MSAPHSAYPVPTSQLHASFLAALPRIERHGKVYFRDPGDLDQRDEFLAEMVALAWLWFVRLVRKGKNPLAFISVLATFAARAVRSGRRLCGQEAARSVLSRRAQRRHDFTVSRLPEHSSLGVNLLDEALHDNTQTPVPEQVCFRCDFPRWRRRHRGRDRRILNDLMLGERTSVVARRYELSPARVSQLRRELHEDWERFCADPPSIWQRIDRTAPHLALCKWTTISADPAFCPDPYDPQADEERSAAQSVMSQPPNRPDPG